MSKMKILIVDDDPDVRHGLHVWLKASQYDSYFAADALSAISEARKVQPDLILLDLGLACGDGFMVMERLRSNTNLACIPVIIASARDPQANQLRALKEGAKAFVHKPFDNDRLLETIREVLGRQDSSLSSADVGTKA
jgi:DNA-binding response OmpR family regulator